MKTYRNHRCTSKHRTVKTFLNCAFPKTTWIYGTGRYGVFAWCNRTITLWADLADADDALRLIDGSACGHRCTKRHEIVYVAGGDHA